MRHTEIIMGMPITIEVADPVKNADITMTAAFKLLRDIDADFSPYKPNSYVSLINRQELALADCPQRVQTVFIACDDARKRTNGYFNIRYKDSVDPSGYVKGWAIDQVSRLLQSSGIGNFIVAAGGDVQTSGKNMLGQAWHVGIKHPVRPHQYAELVFLSGQAIATSGTYERGNHIYNPHTSLPARQLLSLSVIGPNITEVDVVATTAFAMGLKKGLNFIAATGFEGYAISENYSVMFTSGFKMYTRELKHP